MIRHLSRREEKGYRERTEKDRQRVRERERERETSKCKFNKFQALIRHVKQRVIK